ncbi:MRG/MORF4L-binding protein [Fopius arisanus]|uniref:MRG/MORF4L-binding protein n=2 Tax=Fopius arisanus TaxID=64838 RepID=A0A9R1TP60_9HYME|nr:PREDICTED: MRG/MORF4L-binding protein [Fopius arisanus]
MQEALDPMAVKEKQGDSTEEIDWNVENEVQLFFAMNGHKPVGVNKYFHMVCIWEKFRAAINKDVSFKTIWDHLETMYDLVALDDTEDLPFPSSEVDFALPESEFLELIKNKQKEETDVKSKDLKEKVKETKKEKEVKETPKKEIVTREQKTPKEVDKKKEDVKKVVKEPEVKKEKLRDTKDVKKDNKTPKGRGKGKDEGEEPLPVLPVKKERKDSDTSREIPKRVPKRPTRQSIDNASKASSSPRDTPPPKRRRI